MHCVCSRVCVCVRVYVCVCVHAGYVCIGCLRMVLYNIYVSFPVLVNAPTIVTIETKCV